MTAYFPFLISLKPTTFPNLPSLTLRTRIVTSSIVSNKPVCQTCWIRGICGGGCYHEALQEFGEAALPNLHYCVFLREWTEYGIGVFTELEQKNPGFVEKYIVRSRSDVPKELS